MKITKWFWNSIILGFFCLICSTASANTTSPNIENSNFLLLPDIHLNATTLHKMDINPSKVDVNNDIDLDTLQRLLDMIEAGINNKTIATPKFIVFLGDMVQHRRHGMEEVVNDEATVFAELKKFSEQFTPSIPVFFVFGNHDSLSNVWGEFYSKTPSSEGFHSPYEIAITKGWHDGFLTTGKMCDANAQANPPCILNENIQYGYYSAYLQPNLKMIALNTVMFTPQRLGTTEEDAINELNWLETELFNAVLHHDSVLLATHVPFGDNLDDNTTFWIDSDQSRFLQIIQTYKRNIIGMLAAHTHKEEAKVVQEALTNKNIAVLTFGAALSTSTGNAPSFKTIYFSNGSSNSKNSWALTDYETFNFTDAAVAQYFTKINLNKLYKYSDYYCDGQGKTILDCAHNITGKKMEHYYTAGNPNHKEKIKVPENIIVTIPITTPSNSTQNNNNNHSSISGGTVAAIAGGVALAGITIEKLTNPD